MPVFKIELLVMAPNWGLSVSFPRCIVFLVTLALRRSLSTNNFCALVFGLEAFRASGGDSIYSRDLIGVSPPFR